MGLRGEVGGNSERSWYSVFVSPQLRFYLLSVASFIFSFVLLFSVFHFFLLHKLSQVKAAPPPPPKDFQLGGSLPLPRSGVLRTLNERAGVAPSKFTKKAQVSSRLGMLITCVEMIV